MLLTVADPLTAPVVVGSKLTVRVAVWLGCNVTGKLTPETVKPAPETATPLMVKAAVPDAVSDKGCVVGVLRLTLPKDRLLVLRLSVAVAGLSCRAKVFVPPPAAAVSVAVWFEVTADAVAVKIALVAPAATVTDPGTVTELLLLESATAWPPAGAAAVRVTEQASVPAPVIEEFVHKTVLSVPAVGWPVPLRPITTVPFVEAVLVTVSDPVAAPAVVGSN